MTEKLADCVFCAESELTFWRGSQLSALFDIAPVIPGHTLIYSSLHYVSAADVPKEIAAELDEVVDRFRQLYLAEYGAFTLFEHGRTGHCIRRNPQERVCNHMHIHVLPLKADIVPQIGLGQWTRWETWSDVHELAEELEGYVLVETAESGRQFFPVTHTLPSHYLRTAAAGLVGDVGLADWENRVGQPESLAAIQLARATLAGGLAELKAGTVTGGSSG